MFAYPFTAGWVDADGVALERGLTPAGAAGATLALLDSVAALTMLGTHVIVRDIGIVWRTASMLTLTTHTRPDEVETVSVSIEGVSPAGRALATAVLQPFYGITVESWSEARQAIDAEHAAIDEGASALIAVDDENQYQEDLGRAWFLLTDQPFVSHVAVAPRALLVSDPRAIANAVTRVLAARSAGMERGRELRRDLSKGLGIDRDTLTETLADQIHHLDDAALDGLSELARRAGLGMTPSAIRNAAISVSQIGR